MRRITLSFLLLSFVGFYSCEEAANNSETTKPTQEEATVDTVAEEEVVIPDVKPDEKGKELYETNCNLCHGIDGSLGKYGAPNLKKSTMFYSKKIDIITNGSGMMNGYGDKLTKEEIELIAGYLIHLKD